MFRRPFYVGLYSHTYRYARYMFICKYINMTEHFLRWFYWDNFHMYIFVCYNFFSLIAFPTCNILNCSCIFLNILMLLVKCRGISKSWFLKNKLQLSQYMFIQNMMDILWSLLHCLLHRLRAIQVIKRWIMLDF